MSRSPLRIRRAFLCFMFVATACAACPTACKTTVEKIRRVESIADRIRTDIANGETCGMTDDGVQCGTRRDDDHVQLWSVEVSASGKEISGITFKSPEDQPLRFMYDATGGCDVDLIDSLTPPECARIRSLAVDILKTAYRSHKVTKKDVPRDLLNKLRKLLGFK